MMINNWVIFEGKPNGANRGKIRVTINRRSNILLNKKAFETLRKPKAVELCYDRRYGVIGLRPVPVDAQNAFALKPVLNSKYRIVNASPFCKHFNIRFENTTLFTEPALNEEGVLVLDLAKTTTATKGSR